MSVHARLLVLAGLCVWGCLWVASDAHAFFPLGAFDQFRRLEIIRWPWTALNDRNNDGDISGPNEGIEVMIEGGPNGFTEDEQAIVKESFQVWQDVPTSYIGFQFSGPTQDPLALGDGVNDFINSVSMEVPEDLITVGVGGGILGLTIPTYIVDDGPWPETTTDQFPVQIWATGGQIVEMDVVIDAGAHRPAAPGLKAEADLMGTVVHELGHFIGLMHTPLNNVELVTDAATLGYVESPVVGLRDATNTLRLVGATPTMFPILFLVEDGEGNTQDGGIDLAPDDIAGVSFLYPRGSQDQFFTIQQEARTQSSSASLFTVPLPGGHVVAWCDADNNPDTPRVPLFSTMTGLYEIEPTLAGRFFLHGLYKVLETVQGVEPFPATYTLTFSPINGLDVTRQAPESYLPSAFASIEGGVTPLEPPVFPSEVFHEQGNVFDIAKHDLGTPVVFDQARSAAISVSSSKTLNVMLPQRKPMFGDQNYLCPFNVIFSGGGTTPTTPVTTAGLRSLRDRVLLKSAAGTALAEAYYRVSPALARYLVAHAGVLRAARFGGRSLEWILMHSGFGVVLALGVVLPFAARWVLRRRRALVAAVVLIALAVCAAPAFARIQYLTDQDMVRMSDAIVTGTVQSVTSQWMEKRGLRGIFTDIVIQVTDTLKGSPTKDATISIRQVGGRVRHIMTVATDLATFKEGEEVLVYLQAGVNTRSVVVAGQRGKFEVGADSTTGKKFLTASTPEAQKALSETVAKSAKAGNEPKVEAGRVSLEDYKKYIRSLVSEQAKR